MVHLMPRLGFEGVVAIGRDTQSGASHHHRSQALVFVVVFVLEVVGTPLPTLVCRDAVGSLGAAKPMKRWRGTSRGATCGNGTQPARIDGRRGPSASRHRLTEIWRSL